MLLVFIPLGLDKCYETNTFSLAGWEACQVLHLIQVICSLWVPETTIIVCVIQNDKRHSLLSKPSFYRKWNNKLPVVEYLGLLESFRVVGFVVYWPKLFPLNPHTYNMNNLHMSYIMFGVVYNVNIKTYHFWIVSRLFEKGAPLPASCCSLFHVLSSWKRREGIDMDTLQYSANINM